MNFEDEEYVRVYSRDTATTNRIGWEGRTVLWHLARRVPKSGVLELEEGDDLVEVVAALCDLPKELTKLGLERLASRGVTRRHAASLEIVRFVEAQNAKRSDRLRAQDYRERQKSEPPEKHPASPAKEPGPSRFVTARHDSSLPALPLPASPCPALPEIRAIVEQEPDVSEDDLSSFAPDPPKPKPKPPQQEAAERVFNAWAEDTGHPGAKRDTKRMARIAARLRDGFTEAQLVTAIRNRRNDPHLMGSSGPVYDGIETLLRDVAQVERLLGLTAPMRPAALPFRGSRQPEVSPNVDYDTRAALASSRRLQEFLAGAK